MLAILLRLAPQTQYFWSALHFTPKHFFFHVRQPCSLNRNRNILKVCYNNTEASSSDSAMVLKALDPRLRLLLERCQANGHRSLVVLVGDEARNQGRIWDWSLVQNRTKSSRNKIF